MQSLHNTSTSLALVALLLVLGSSPVSADLVHITYFDQSSVDPINSGGPLWEGVVDTVSNNLRIDTWRELPGHGADFWVPGNLPLVWEALDASGNPYDVPASFGTTAVAGAPGSLTATIGADFGFFSGLTLAEMPWNEGAFTGPSGSAVIPGWGGVALRNAAGVFVYHTDTDPTTPVFTPRALDESILLFLPVSATDPNVSLEATIIVTSRTVSSDPYITAVPEPSAFLAVGLVGAASAASNWRRRRRGPSSTPATL